MQSTHIWAPKSQLKTRKQLIRRSHKGSIALFLQEQSIIVSVTWWKMNEMTKWRINSNITHRTVTNNQLQSYGLHPFETARKFGRFRIVLLGSVRHNLAKIGYHKSHFNCNVHFLPSWCNWLLKCKWCQFSRGVKATRTFSLLPLRDYNIGFCRAFIAVSSILTVIVPRRRPILNEKYWTINTNVVSLKINASKEN